MVQQCNECFNSTFNVVHDTSNCQITLICTHCGTKYELKMALAFKMTTKGVVAVRKCAFCSTIISSDKDRCERCEKWGSDETDSDLRFKEVKF